MHRKQKKEGTIASEVQQAYYENMNPIYETMNNEKSDDSHTGNNNFGMHLDTMTSNESAYYENSHSRETKCCHNTSIKIDTVTASK